MSMSGGDPINPIDLGPAATFVGHAALALAMFVFVGASVLFVFFSLG